MCSSRDRPRDRGAADGLSRLHAGPPGAILACLRFTFAASDPPCKKAHCAFDVDGEARQRTPSPSPNTSPFREPPMTLIGWLQYRDRARARRRCGDSPQPIRSTPCMRAPTSCRPCCAGGARNLPHRRRRPETREQSWFAYTMSMLAFTIAGFFVALRILRLQNLLPLNPQGFDAVPPDLAFNTAISFITNTNWQSYGGETTMSHLTQMPGLTVHNFLSAAAGIAMAAALVRAFARQPRRPRQFLGRSDPHHLYVLLPLSIVVALALRRAAACRRRLPARSTRRRWKAPSSRSRSVRSPARRRSSNSAPTAAASSTPTRPIRSRTPTPSPTLSRCGRCWWPRRLRLAFGRVGRRPARRAARSWSTMGDPARRRRRRRLLGRERRHPV